MVWWNMLPDTMQEFYQHRLPWDDEKHVVIRNGDYYEYIGRYDQFQLGWDDIPWDAYPPPFGDPVMSPNRYKYITLWNDR